MFVRTEYGIYNTKNLKQDRYCYYDENSKLQDNVYLTVVSKNEIIKQADTIEELCDEFVLVAKDEDFFQTSRINTRHWVFDDLADTEHKEDEIGKGISRTIYGAIWTDKGLIYVAKMNEKGELELL